MFKSFTNWCGCEAWVLSKLKEKKEVLSFNTEKYEKQREKSAESASSLAIPLLILTIQLKLKSDCILVLSFAPTKRQHSKCQLYNL